MSATTVAAGVGLLIQLIEQAARVSVLIRQAQAEGRELTSAELSAIIAENDAARGALVAEIARAQAAGR